MKVEERQESVLEEGLIGYLQNVWEKKENECGVLLKENNRLQGVIKGLLGDKGRLQGVGSVIRLLN